MSDSDQVLYGLIREIRLSFNLLRAHADEMHKDLGVNASMRAVMESLTNGAEKTVPEIARSKSVSRQHIQLIVNALNDANLVVARQNPQDKRTYLVALSHKGEKLFSEIRRREADELKRLSQAFSAPDIEISRKVLGTLCDALKGEKNA